MSILRYIYALRPVNLLMTVFILVSVKYGLLKEYGDTDGSDAYFWIYVLSVLCVMAFGYLINDYYDVETDKINKPGKNIFEDAPSQRIWILGSVCVFLGVAPAALLLAIDTRTFLIPFLANVVALGALFIYAKHGKGRVLRGNLLIAFLAYILPVAAFFASGHFLHANNHNGKQMALYAVFSFLTTLLREIVKDAEDVDGDARSGIHTLATQYGTSASRYVASVVNILLIVLLAYTSGKYHANQGIAFLVLAVYGIFTLFILWYSREKAGFRRTSLALKIYMVLGILSMWL